MSPKHRLSVTTTDPLAEISVFDGAFKCVGRGVGSYTGEHEDGLYEVRARLVGASEAKLVSLDHDLSVGFGSFAFTSSIPLTGTRTHGDAVVAVAEDAARHPRRLGEGSAVFLMVRDGSAGSEAGAGPICSPAFNLALIGPAGEAHDLAALAGCGEQPGAAAATSLEVDPGAYRLRLTLPDGSARERALIASRGWATQCFLVRRRMRGGVLPDLDQGAVAIARLDKDFDADDENLRLAEAARDALANHRKIAEAATDALMTRKFEDPMLGLYVAHLLLRDTPEAPVLGTVIENLLHLLGPDHPDVQALALGTPLQPVAPRIEQMPMLRASWDRVVEHSLAIGGLVPPDSPAGKVATRVLPSAPWLVWEPADAPSRRLAAKAAAVTNYLHQRVKPGGLRALMLAVASRSPVLRSLLTRLAAGLDEADRKELAQALGVPASRLHNLLSKLGR